MIDRRAVTCCAMLLEHVVKVDLRPSKAIPSFGLLSDTDLGHDPLISVGIQRGARASHPPSPCHGRGRRVQCYAVNHVSYA